MLYGNGRLLGVSSDNVGDIGNSNGRVDDSE